MGISVFEIIGPIMIGPSSSHTAGMARSGMMACRIAGDKAASIHLALSPKMRTTYAGHRSDAALIGGAMGLRESDPEIREAVALARNRGIETAVDFLPDGLYPQNTALITVADRGGRATRILGTSVGGGSIVISAVDDVQMNIRPDAYHLIAWSGGPLPENLGKGASVQSGQNGRETVTCFTFTTMPSRERCEALRSAVGVHRMSVVEPVLEYGVSLPSEKRYASCEEVCRAAAENRMTVAEVSVEYEAARSGRSKEAVRQQMHRHFEQIRKSVQEGEQGSRMLYGLTSGRDGPRMLRAIQEGRTVSGGIIPLAVARAVGVMEYNGAMGCIVAAPTAGSSGIIPGSMTAVQDQFGFRDEDMVDALFVSALAGVVMAEREVSFSGSVGGCQGEVGVSSAITAAGLTSLFTREPEAIFHAMAMSLKNLLGLVCDPIAGPIEVPCIKRNAVGVSNAFTAADMALSGIRSYIPPDEVIDALVDTERRLPQELKCATVGGLACTATACRLRKQLASGI